MNKHNFPVEIEIVQHDGTPSTAVIQVRRSDGITRIMSAARQLAATCQWKQYRIGIGSGWSGWQKTNKP